MPAFTGNNTFILQLVYQLHIPTYMQMEDWLTSNQKLHSTNSRVANRNRFRCRYTIFLDFPLHNTRTNTRLQQ